MPEQYSNEQDQNFYTGIVMSAKYLLEDFHNEPAKLMQSLEELVEQTSMQMYGLGKIQKLSEESQETIYKRINAAILIESFLKNRIEMINEFEVREETRKVLLGSLENLKIGFFSHLILN